MMTDIAIVGGGPAGAWAAYQLASAGARVTLFDHSHPREKPCGGGLSERAQDVVRGVFGPADGETVVVDSARFETRIGGSGPAGPWSPAVATTVPLVDRRAATSGPLLITPRRLFDQRLVDAATTAGAQLVTSRVRDVEIQRNGARILTAGREHRAGFLIGADGANSLVRRRLLGAFSRSQLSIATGLFAHGISSSHIIVRFVARPPGYIWSFPRGNHLAIGICAQADESTPAGLRDEIRSWIETAHAPGTAPTHGATCLEPYSWPIPSLSETDLDRFRAGGDRWLLIGDAAGLVDPITREGIYFALRSGAIAAECLGEGNGSARRYTSTIRDEICPELIRAASLKRGFFTTWFTRLTVEALAESQAIRASLVDLAAGRLPYRKLRRRLLRQLEPSAACRLLWREVRVAARRF